MSETAKPCPFCGYEALIKKRPGGYEIECASVDCPVSVLVFEDTLDAALSIWNRRAAPDGAKECECHPPCREFKRWHVQGEDDGRCARCDHFPSCHSSRPEEGK